MNQPLLTAASAAARYGVIVALATAFLAAQPAPNTTTSAASAEPQKLEKFEVTGSRVKRLDVETPAPVVQISRQDIDQSGLTTLGDFVQTLPFNSGQSNSIVQTASFTRGAATVNPRGLGSHRFLVLVNGRRSISYALTNSNNQSVFDFNSIPLGAIDSISYLKDGASAIYGSDAVTGVMDIKLKKNFTGLELDLLAGNTIGHDTFTKTASIVAGAQAGKTSILLVGNYAGANDNYIRDYDRSKTTDYSSMGAKGANLNSSLNFPANINLTAAQATAAGYTTGAGLYVLTGGSPTANPARSQFARVAAAPNENRYDFAQTYQLFPPYDYRGVYGNIRHDVTDRLYVFSEIMYNQNTTAYNFTPSVIQSTQNAGTGPTGLLNIPPTNPYNPFGVDLTNFLYRTNFGPPRQFDTEGSTGTYLVGIGGDLTPDWTWEAGASMAQSTVSTVSRNQIRASDLQAALNGTTRTTALNPFGPSDNADVVNRLFTVSNSTYKNKSEMFDANVTGSFFDLGAGPLGFAAGGEVRRDMIRQDPDTQSYVGSGGGTPYRGDRDVYSAFAELTLPLLNRERIGNIELQLAGRYEDYSDFGTTTKPKAALKYKLPSTRLVDTLLRVSYSESFKAPDLGRLYTAATTAFSSTVRQDPKRPQDPPTQLRIVTGGNPLLQPEEAETYYAGAVFDLKFIKGLSIAFDYFKFDIDNVISSPADTTLLAREDQFPGAVVRDSTQGNPGPILFLRRVPFNVAKQWYEGADIEVKYELRNTRLGNFRFLANATRTISIKSNSGIRDAAGNLPADFENIGLWNNPKWNATGSVAWQYKDYGAAVFLRHTGKYFNDAYTVAGWGENPVNIVNASVSYKGLLDTRITLGVNNVLDAEPPRNGYETSGFDQSTYGGAALGRFVYVRLSRTF